MENSFLQDDYGKPVEEPARDIGNPHNFIMEQVLEHYDLLGTFKRSGNRLCGPCPIHKGANPTQFSLIPTRMCGLVSANANTAATPCNLVGDWRRVARDAALKASLWFSVPLEEVKCISLQEEQQAAMNNLPTMWTPRIPPSWFGIVPGRCKNSNRPLNSRLDELDKTHLHISPSAAFTGKTAFDFGIGYFHRRRLYGPGAFQSPNPQR